MYKDKSNSAKTHVYMDVGELEGAMHEKYSVMWEIPKDRRALQDKRRFRIKEVHFNKSNVVVCGVGSDRFITYILMYYKVLLKTPIAD